VGLMDIQLKSDSAKDMEIATSIKESIIYLTDRLETEEQLWDAYKIINKGISYLGAKHTMTQVREE
tara:strand:+ start:447 stop:644 length:198 start_codon:yes stop_codon:yes gene_type:complete